VARVLLTGATGFVGQHVLPALIARGHDVVSLVRRPIPGPSIVGDIRDAIPLDGFDAVVHLAATVDPAKQNDPREVSAVVGDATIELARRARGRFVFISSIAAVGFRDGVVTPHSECAPVTPYGMAKRRAELALLDRGAVVLRPPTIHGPGERYNFLSLVRAVRRGLFRTIGGGHNTFPLVSVANVARAIVHAVAGRVPPGIHMLADPERYSMRRIHRAVADALGVPMPRVSIPRHVARVAAATNDALARLGAPLILGRDRLRTLTVDQPFDVTSLLATGVRLTTSLEDDVRETVTDQRARGLVDQ
jgi:nucleoside-diphosphate-sugar epimerase